MRTIRLNRETKIGLFAALCIAALVWGINFLKGRNIFSPNNIYYAWFDAVDGLEPSNSVLISGFKVGTVRSISFEDMQAGRFLVSFLVDKKYRIPRHTEAKLVSADLMGTKALRLDVVPGHTPYSPGDTLPSAIEAGLFDQIASQAGPIKQRAEQLLDEAQRAIAAFNQLFDTHNQQQLSRSIDELHRTLQHAGNVLAGLQGQLAPTGTLGQTLSNLESISTSVKGRNNDIERMLTNLAAVSDTLQQAHLGSTIGALNAALQELNATLGGLNSGRGSMGKLMRNDSLYTNLARASQQLDLLLRNINENPKKYLKLSVF
ncbi:MAG: MCE family protein [Bacteroidales bacterium]|nr:MCE family protein [Bacteroidales bacterium]